MGNSGVSRSGGSPSEVTATRSGQVTTLAARPDRIGPCVVPGSARADGHLPTIRRCSSARGCAAPPCAAAPPTGWTSRASIYRGRETALRSSSVTGSPTVFASRQPGPCWLTFARHGGVAAADFRGHGRSGGRSSVGRDETLDLDAVVHWTRGQGYRLVVGRRVLDGSGRRAAARRRRVLLRATRWSRCPRRPAGTSGRARRCGDVQWLLESPFGLMVGSGVGSAAG